MIMSDTISQQLCYSIGSAYLIAVPVVVAGYGMPYRDYLSKFDFVLRTIENAALGPEDVILVLDSDTLFTGVDLDPLLDRFIAHSAARPGDLDVLAVRQATAMAPFIVSAEINCHMPQLYGVSQKCVQHCKNDYKKVREYAAAHPEHRLALPFDKSPQHHLNSGAILARVWAYKELVSFSANLQKKEPPFGNQRAWGCDQSVIAKLFYHLIVWEVEQDLFSKPLRERQEARSDYGVRAGLIELDYTNTISILFPDILDIAELHPEHWAKHLSLDGLKLPESPETYDNRNVIKSVKDLYTRAYAASGDSIYTRLPLPSWVKGTRTRNRKTHINLTPPTLALKLRPIDTVENVTRRTFPAILHSAGGTPGESLKLTKLEHTSWGARWSLPLAHDKRAREQARAYLKSAPLFLSTKSSILRDSYDSKCGFPFTRIIETIEKY